jgi:phospholipid N-methyltransferase
MSSSFDSAPPLPSTPRLNKRPPDWWLFFNKFLRHGTAIASFVPSSVWLAKALIRDIDFARARCIVELGAGTGPVTAELLRRAGTRCHCVIIERDPDFCRRLRERFPQADVVEADALDLERVMAERGIEAFDHVLCGLPLPSFPEELRDRLLGIVGKRLAPAGTFRQITNMPWVYYKLYRRYFQKVRFCLEVRNLPPAGFYVCER